MTGHRAVRGETRDGRAQSREGREPRWQGIEPGRERAAMAGHRAGRGESREMAEKRAGVWPRWQTEPGDGREPVVWV